MRRHTIFLALSSFTLSSLVVASETIVSGEAESKILVENFVHNMHTLSGRFEQSLFDVNNQLVETSRGTLKIQRPDQFRWSYFEPYDQVLVADELNVWSYDVDLAQVTVKPRSEVLNNTPALLLSGSSDVLDQFDYIGSFTDHGTIWVQLRPKGMHNEFNKIELGFNDGELIRIMFSDNLEQTILISLFDVSLNEDIDIQHFQFELPEDVDIIGIPAKSE